MYFSNFYKFKRKEIAIFSNLSEKLLKSQQKQKNFRFKIINIFNKLLFSLKLNLKSIVPKEDNYIQY